MEVATAISMLIQSPLKGKQNMKHTTPPLGPSALPDTDAEFQKYKNARGEGYSIIKALIELKFDAGIQDPAQYEQIIQEHLAMEPIMIAPWRNSVPLTQAACRDGMRLAALTFFWDHRHELICLAAQDDTDTLPFSLSPN